jgi:hypothetical protein
MVTNMLKLKYCDHEVMYLVGFDLVDQHIIRLIGDLPANTSGFSLSRDGHDDNWDYSSYKTIYRQGEGFIEYSNDGSVYIQPDPSPEVPVQPEPSVDDRVAALEAQLAAYESAYAQGVAEA